VDNYRFWPPPGRILLLRLPLTPPAAPPNGAITAAPGISLSAFVCREHLIQLPPDALYSPRYCSVRKNNSRAETHYQPAATVCLR